MTDADDLRTRARQWGLAEGFFDLWGVYHATSPKSLAALLDALGALEADARFPATAPVTACPPDTPQEVTVTVPAAPGPWTLVLRTDETEQALLGAARAPSADRSDAVELTGRLLSPLPEGLHLARVIARAPGTEITGETLLVVSPSRGHEPDAVARGDRLWGVNLPLYGLRSARNGGLGDFEDLARLAEWAAGLGADLLGVLPLHALGNEPPYGISPYFPMSRAFLNPALVAVDCLPEAAAPEVQALLTSPAVVAELARLRATALVDHKAAWALKRRALAACHSAFGREHRDGPRGAAFRAWREGQGQALEDFATFSAVRERYPRPWQEWPGDLRSPRAPGVAAFRQTHPEEVEFHAWAQWVAEEQLARAQVRALAAEWPWASTWTSPSGSTPPGPTPGYSSTCWPSGPPPGPPPIPLA